MQVNFRKIDLALDNIENYPSYYVGATLFIDFKYHPSIALNLNGRGFAYNPHDSKKYPKFVVTKKMQDKINKIYKKYKIDRKKEQKWLQ